MQRTTTVIKIYDIETVFCDPLTDLDNLLSYFNRLGGYPPIEGVHKKVDDETGELSSEESYELVLEKYIITATMESSGYGYYHPGNLTIEVTDDVLTHTIRQELSKHSFGTIKVCEK